MRNAGRDPEKHDEMNRQGVGVGEPGDPAHTVTSACVHAVAQPMVNMQGGNGGYPNHAVSYSIQGSLIGRQDHNGPQGDGINEEVSFTLNTIDRHAVAQPMVLIDQGGSVMNVEHDIVGTLRRETHGHEPAVIQPVGQIGWRTANADSGEVSQTLKTDLAHQSGPCLAFKVRCGCEGGGKGYLGSEESAFTLSTTNDQHIAQPIAPALTASNDPSRSPQSSEVTQQVAAVHAASMAVRRLTPVECERLQGFPDNYTNIPWRNNPESPDGPRYKALGNSMAVPVMRWLGDRIDNKSKSNS
jgi:DNA (cytosine-5)-methyltransferase 1